MVDGVNINQFSMHIYQFAKRVISPAIIKVRKDLSREYNVKSGDHIRYAGLCYIACDKLINQLEESKKDLIFDFRYKRIHGEQKHSPRIKSKFWPIQHTWLEIYYEDSMGKCTIYVDPTSGQFKDLYPEIPDYFILFEEPKWYYPDKNNPMWNIHFKNNSKSKRWMKICDFIQYEIWGRISDSINILFYNKK